MAFQSFTDIRANEPDAHVMAMREYACEQALEANARSRAFVAGPVPSDFGAVITTKWRDASWDKLNGGLGGEW